MIYPLLDDVYLLLKLIEIKNHWKVSKTNWRDAKFW